jgi:nitric oxide reductase NorQ protein
MSEGMIIPEIKPFFVSKTTKDCLAATVKMSQTRPQNILVKGMQGCGKSELAEQFAARFQRPFAGFQVGLLAESGQLFGQQVLRNNNVSYEKFLFIDAIQVKDAVILLDEINRAENPKALNALFSVLDDRRTIWIDEIHKLIPVSPSVIFFATINEGADFTGTDTLDAAISDRFFVVEMGVLPEEQEKELLIQRTGIGMDEAASLVAVFNSIRRSEVPVSTRKALTVAELIQTGLDLREAFIFTLGINRDELEKILISIHLTTEEEMGTTEEWTLL